MKNHFNLIYIVLILFVSLSCAERETSEKEISRSELPGISTTDTIKFTSGIGAIFQDSKGNYWFGSHS